jgi:hypothetical protein
MGRMAGQYTIDVEQGATWPETWTWRDAAGALVDLTGYTARMSWRDRAGAVALDFTTENGRITLGGAAGTVTPTATAADTGALPAPAVLSYDLFLTSPGGVVTRLLAGDVRVTPRVTA